MIHCLWSATEEALSCYILQCIIFVALCRVNLSVVSLFFCMHVIVMSFCLILCRLLKPWNISLDWLYLNIHGIKLQQVSGLATQILTGRLIFLLSSISCFTECTHVGGFKSSDLMYETQYNNNDQFIYLPIHILWELQCTHSIISAASVFQSLYETGNLRQPSYSHLYLFFIYCC